MCDLCNSPAVDIKVDGIKMCKACYDNPDTEPTCETCGLATSDCNCGDAGDLDIDIGLVDD